MSDDENSNGLDSPRDSQDSPQTPVNNTSSKILGAIHSFKSETQEKRNSSKKDLGKRKSLDNRKSASNPATISDATDPATYFQSPGPVSKTSVRVKELKAGNEELKKATLKTYEGLYSDIKAQTGNLNAPLSKSLKEMTEISQNMASFQENLAQLCKSLKETMPEYPTMLKIKL